MLHFVSTLIHFLFHKSHHSTPLFFPSSPFSFTAEEELKKDHLGVFSKRQVRIFGGEELRNKQGGGCYDT